MKLSEFKGEDAIELLADIMEPAANIMSDPEIKEMYLAKAVNAKIAAYILREHPDEILDIYCVMNKTTKDTATPITLLQATIDVMNDDALLSLFTSQVQNEEEESSGPVMENTEASET